MGTNPHAFPVDVPQWNPLRDRPSRLYYIMQPLGVVDLYFAAAILDQPTDPISKWLYSKLGSMPNSGLNARTIKGAFYPTRYEDWRTRRMLNLSNDYITNDINNRGPPNIVRRIVQQADLFKVHCLQFTARILSEDEVRNIIGLL